MNTNAATEEVAQLYASRFPSTPKGTAERMHQFAGLVGPGKQWDHKGPILDLLDESLAEGPCPTQQCSRTITLCGACYSYDVFSNIHYGYIGSVAGFIAPVLIAAPAVVQEGGDTPIEKIILEAEDTPAVTTGIEVHRRLWWYRLFFPQQNPWPGVVTRQMLCTAVERRSAQLSARFVGPACRACAESWIPEGGHEPQ